MCKTVWDLTLQPVFLSSWREHCVCWLFHLLNWASCLSLPPKLSHSNSSPALPIQMVIGRWVFSSFRDIGRKASLYSPYHSPVWTEVEATGAAKQENVPKERTNPHCKEFGVVYNRTSSGVEAHGFLCFQSTPLLHLLRWLPQLRPLCFPLLTSYLHGFVAEVIMMSFEICSQHFECVMEQKHEYIQEIT